jgi:hypothetical protein
VDERRPVVGGEHHRIAADQHIAVRVARVLNVLRRRGGAELTRQAARKAHPLALDVAAGVAKESKRPGKVAELDADLLQQRVGVAFDRLEAFFAQHIRERDLAGDVRDRRMRAMGARGPARLAAASWLPGGGRCGFRHRVLAFPDVHFARSAGTLRQPEVELNPKIKAHA